MWDLVGNAYNLEEPERNLGFFSMAIAVFLLTLDKDARNTRTCLTHTREPAQDVETSCPRMLACYLSSLCPCILVCKMG